MKITNYLLLFCIVFITIATPLDIEIQQLMAMTQQNVEYNNAVDSAIDDAVSQLVEAADMDQLQVGYTKCIDNFYNSLFAAFGALDSEVMQQNLLLHTPVLCIADFDGFTIIHNKIGKNGKLCKAWTEKLPYQKTFFYLKDGYNKQFYTVNFTLTDKVSVKFEGDQRIYTGTYSELKQRYPGSNLDLNYYEHTIFNEPGTFNNWRTKVITQSIIEQMNYYDKENNDIARSYGIKYDFHIPETAGTDLANGISGITFLALFQGYPYGTGTKETFNKFCVSGAHVVHTKVFYVRPSVESNGKKRYFYHKPGCKEYLHTDASGNFSGEGYAVDSSQKAAASGAMPCPHCCY